MECTTECPVNYGKRTISNIIYCFNPCPEGTYKKLSYNNGVRDFYNCESCQNGCSACTGPLLIECTACSTGYYFMTGQGCLTTCPSPNVWRDSYYNECATACPAGPYVVIQTK